MNIKYNFCFNSGLCNGSYLFKKHQHEFPMPPIQDKKMLATIDNRCQIISDRYKSDISN